MEILREELEKVRMEYGLDILTITDQKRSGPYSDPYSLPGRGFQGNDEMVRRALKKEIVASTEIIPQEELAKEGAELVRQVYMEFVPTPKAKERPETQETSGMMLKAAVPILDINNNILGVLYGGNLSTATTKSWTKSKTSFSKGSVIRERIGTATIFQWDLRISTNVKDKSGLRAIGTRIARDVYDQVLENGRAWIDRAFVVSEWYIAAYEPIATSREKSSDPLRGDPGRALYGPA